MGNLLSTPAHGGKASAAHHNLSSVQMDRRKSFNNLLRAVDPRLLRNQKGSGSGDKGEDGKGDSAAGSDVALLLSNYGIVAMAAMSAAGFFMLRLTTRAILERFDWYGSIQRHTSFELNVVGTLNAVVVASYGIHKCFLSPRGWRDVRGCHRICAWLLGYFVHDLCAMAPVWWKDPTLAQSHAVAIFCCGFVLRHPELRPFVAPLSVVEVSNVFLNLLWGLREAGLGQSQLSKLTLVLFVATFFASRVVWMPLVVSRVLNKPELKARGAWRFALVGMMMHNFHRFRQIIQMTARLAKQ